MGHIYVTTTFIGTRESWTGECFVDTGATFSILPIAIADQIGITFTGRVDRPTVARGQQIEVSRGLCDVLIQVDAAQRRNQVFVWVMEGEGQPVIGSETLEVLGLKADPTTGKVEIARDWMVHL